MATEIKLKKKYRVKKDVKKTSYTARTGNSNGRTKLSKAKRVALGRGVKS